MSSFNIFLVKCLNKANPSIFSPSINCAIRYRPLNNVWGFTRETLIALAANLETRRYHHEFNLANGIPVEHPRSSTTDDVECFFSILRDTVGKDFTLKQVGCLHFIACAQPFTGLLWMEEGHLRIYEEIRP